MSRRFVLVTASYVQNGRALTASGIRKLKRGVSLPQFIEGYLTSVGTSVDDVQIFRREDTYTVSDAIHSWNFTEFPEDELFSAVSHLTKDELLRDLHELLPLKAMG